MVVRASMAYFLDVMPNKRVWSCGGIIEIFGRSGVVYY